MANLQDLPTRRITARQVTSNRDGVLPNRRITELPNVAVRADMRTASRGDPSDELRRVLGMIPQGVATVGEIQNNNIAEAAPGDSAQGALDAAGGAEADAAKAKSAAYQEAFYGVRAESRFNEFASTVGQETDELLNSGAGSDEIQTAVLGKVAAFRDEVLDTIPSDQARLATGQRLSSMTAKLQSELTVGLKERTDRELLDTHSGNIQTRLKSGQPVTFEADVGTLTAAGMNPKDAKSRVLATVLAVALDRDNPQPQLLDELLASKRADGKTPSLSPEEQMQVHDRVSQVDSIIREKEKRDREEAQKTYELKWYQAALEGGDVDDDIDAQVREGTFTAAEGIAWRNATEGLRNGEAEGEDNEGLVLDLRLKLADPKANPQTIRQQVISAYNKGQLGTGLAAKRAYVNLMGTIYSQIEVNENKAEARRNAAAGKLFSAKAGLQDAQEYFDSQLRPRSVEGFAPSQDQYRRYVEDSARWRAKVIAGTDPLKAADEIIAESKGRTVAPARTPVVRQFGADGKLR